VEKVLIIPDLHSPYQHKDSFSFIKSLTKKIKPDLVVILGDEIDGHMISFHEKDIDLPFSASSELEAAIDSFSTLYDYFKCPVKILESNHGSLVYRKAKFHGLPKSVLKPWNQILNAPKNFEWVYELEHQGVLYRHSFQKSPLRACKDTGMNIVQGHFHTQFNIEFWANERGIKFGMTCGSLVDHNSLAFSYAKSNLIKPVLGCAVIENGIPSLIPMKTKNNRWMGP
jgi:hypothetical protein